MPGETRSGLEVMAAQGIDDFIVDGEIVAFEGRVTNFRAQDRQEAREVKKEG